VYTGLEAMSICVVQVTTAPSSPSQHSHVPMPAEHPDNVDITAALHMAHSWMHIRPIVDASTPKSLLAPQGPSTQHCPGYVCQQTFDHGSPLARRTKESFPICRQWYLQAAPADAAVLSMFRSCHLSEPPLDGLPGPLDTPAPANPCIDFACTWCHSDITPP
jgi:hypothetical protein